MRRLLIKDLLFELGSIKYTSAQQKQEYFCWIGDNLVDIVDEFVEANKLMESSFIKSLNAVFNTTRFELLLKRWVVEYFLKLFSILDDLAASDKELKRALILEDNPLNRFAVEKYSSRFKIFPNLIWKKEPSLLQRVFNILLRPMAVSCFSLNNGIKISGGLKRYKVMREALWGLYGVGGYYFHDDFFVDGDKIKREDLLLFSRGVPVESSRLKGYHDARKSPYAYFNLMALPMSVGVFILRIIPKYIFSFTKIFIKEIKSHNFSFYWSIYLYFIYNAMPYEKVFSHFRVTSELGHNYYSLSHIPESIVCQNYRARYYLMHWSDFTLPIIKHSLAFLGCYRFLIWGKAHGKGIECDSSILIPTGYVFKRFIKEVAFNRDKVLSEMGIKARGKIITFFDETFGRGCEMTEKHFVVFWKTILKLAEQEKSNTVVVKPKDSNSYNFLSPELKEEHLATLDKILKMKNVYFINENRWSFIEAIGISDIVVTQGMTTSSTVAIICGIEGLYLDQFGYEHEFSRFCRDKIVFDDPEKLIDMIRGIIKGEKAPSKNIPEALLREFDEYPDDRGIDLFRNILSGLKQEGVL